MARMWKALPLCFGAGQPSAAPIPGPHTNAEPKRCVQCWVVHSNDLHAAGQNVYAYVRGYVCGDVAIKRSAHPCGYTTFYH
ncbi:unnamed protein product [Peniophora sp. CBMAI 1063]|nr:unnamed protein product [Peniophora sp. CBMAI 1063]